MELSIITSNASGQAATVKTLEEMQAERLKNGTRESSAHAGGDIVTISEEAREMQRAAASGETGEKKENGGEENGAFANASALASSGSASGEGGDEAIERIRRQIKDVQEKLRDAQARLAHAMSEEQGNATQDAPAASPPRESAFGAEASVPQPDGAAMSGSQTEADGIRQEISNLNNQLLQLNQKLQEAMQSGGTGGSNIAGGAGSASGGFGLGPKTVGGQGAGA